MGIITGGKIIEGALPRVGARQGDPTAEGVTFGEQIARFRYDFAVEGGGVGVIPLAAAALALALPAEAVVIGGFVDVITPPTSGGAATVSVNLEAAGDIVAAAAISGAPWSTVGRKSIIPAGTGATTVKTTVARTPAITVAVAALTAGVFDVYLRYIVTA
jgi:hypothetical protein